MKPFPPHGEPLPRDAAGRAWGWSGRMQERLCIFHRPSQGVKGKGQEEPSGATGEVRGAVCNLEGVREFGVWLWFALPSSLSPFQRVGGIFVRPCQQRRAVWLGRAGGHSSAPLYKYSGCSGAV